VGVRARAGALALAQGPVYFWDSRKAIRSARSLGAFRPANTILVPCQTATATTTVPISKRQATGNERERGERMGQSLRSECSLSRHACSAGRTGMNLAGFSRYLKSWSWDQVTPDLALASVYAKPGAEPDLRPTMPNRLGPCLWPPSCTTDNGQRTKRNENRSSQRVLSLAHRDQWSAGSCMCAYLVGDVALCALGLEDLGTLCGVACNAQATTHDTAGGQTIVSLSESEQRSGTAASEEGGGVPLGMASLESALGGM
jgi:hypothetical protein